MIGEEGRIIGRIDENGNIIATDIDSWNGEEHGKNMWIVWWVLATIGVTLAAVIGTFIMLKRKHFKPNKNMKERGYKQDGNAIEMNKIDYHTVQKHTIKPAVRSEPGNTEKQELNV